tara:strand:+ start:1409 stop:1744 length:336 start_codon:yes stop_codon:yes gene_type:complete
MPINKEEVVNELDVTEVSQKEAEAPAPEPEVQADPAPKATSTPRRRRPSSRASSSSTAKTSTRRSSSKKSTTKTLDPVEVPAAPSAQAPTKKKKRGNVVDPMTRQGNRRRG